MTQSSTSLALQISFSFGQIRKEDKMSTCLNPQLKFNPLAAIQKKTQTSPLNFRKTHTYSLNPPTNSSQCLALFAFSIEPHVM